MRPRHMGAPEVAPSDIEGQRSISMAGAGGKPLIQPFGGHGADANAKNRKKGGGFSLGLDGDSTRTIGMVVGGIWLVGWWFLGYDALWPIFMAQEIVGVVLSYVLSFPPLSWIFGAAPRGAPLVTPFEPAQEMSLPSNQVSQYAQSYVQEYGEVALVSAAHDGLPQIVQTLLLAEELGFEELIDAEDDSGNTALTYAAARGFQQCTAALIRNGADPDVANRDHGGRTPLMEAAGAGHREIVVTLRSLPNISIDRVDAYGNTALHYAAYHGNLAVVLELLKSNPNKDLPNAYGDTPLKFAMLKKHQSVVDALTRQGPTRSQRMAQERKQHEEKKKEKKEEKKEDSSTDYMKELQDQLKKFTQKQEEKKAEDPPPAPKSSKAAESISDAERKALEDQIAKMRQDHDEAELKSQRRIVELLDKSSEHQNALDQAKAEQRAALLNSTELQFRVAELESRHRASELRVADEESRANRLHDEHQQAKFEAERHSSRADAAERERDHHIEMGKRHQQNSQRIQEEVTTHLSRAENQQREMAQLREQLHRMEEEKRRHESHVDQLSSELRELRGGSSGKAIAGDGDATLRDAAASLASSSAVGEVAPSSPYTVGGMDAGRDSLLSSDASMSDTVREETDAEM